MNKTKILLGLLLCTATLCQTNNCPGFNGGDLIQAGSQILIKSSPPGVPEHNYSLRVLFSIPNTGLDAAATTSTIAGFNPSSGFSYMFQVGRKQQTEYVDIVLVIPENQSWQSININYLFSGRTDLAVGNFDTQYYQWKNLGTGVKEVTHGITKVLPTNQNYQVAAFISGFSTSDPKFSVSINQPYYIEAQKTIGVIFNHKSDPYFNQITFSYVIYPRTHPILTFDYSSIIPSNLGSYYFSGPFEMNSNAIDYDIWRVLNRNIPCIGAQCSGKNCILIEQCNKLGGNYFQDQCYFCPDGIIFQSGRCLQRCGANQFYFGRVCMCNPGYIRQGIDCVKKQQCGTNQVWNAQTNSCVCDQGSINYAQKCVRCPANSFVNAAQDSCECTDVGKEYIILTNTCNDKCKANQVWKTNKCVCIPQYHWWSGNCRTCPSNSAPNADQTTCNCANPNQIYDADSNSCKNCQQNAQPNQAKTGCVCSTGYTFNQNNQCVQAPPVCIINEVYNQQTNQCDCIFGFRRIAPNTPCVPICAQNEEYTGTGCVCKDGFARYNGQPCRQCPAPTRNSPDKTTCLCLQDNYYFVPNELVCKPCPPNSSPSADDRKCDCNSGWTLQGSTCVSNCPNNSSPGPNGDCICNNKYYKDNGVCKPQPVCPPNSQWNGVLLACQCEIQNQYLINGVCKGCGQNEGWTGVECVCKAGWNRFNGNCVQCSPQAFWNGKECECNGGWYGNGLTCQQCHSSCRKCTGPNANQCTQCTDISLTLQNGFCTKTGVCDPGTFLDGNTCSQCSQNCISCTSLFDCKVCADGFEVVQLPIPTGPIFACNELCGDGTRFQSECDDGNDDNNDGCNEYCEVEAGWDCNGGGAQKPDFCTQNIPENVVLTSKGAVNLGSEIVFNVRANYLPPCITNFNCQFCHDALSVKIFSSVNYAKFTVNFNQFSKYQWNVRVQFDQIISVPVKLSVKLNEAYKNKNSCFSNKDFNQELVIVIKEPRDLIKADQISFLDLFQPNY